MKSTSSTDMFIEDLVNATYGGSTNARQRFVFRETLLGLVRLAKAEQVLEMRTSLEKLIGGPSSTITFQRARSRQRNHAQSGRWPQQMEFSQFD